MNPEIMMRETPMDMRAQSHLLVKRGSTNGAPTAVIITATAMPIMGVQSVGGL
jgi:hypothetical protein